MVKNPPAKAGDIRDEGSFPGSGSSPGGGHGNPLQYSCLENPMDRGAWRAVIHRVTKSQAWLKRLSTRTFSSKLLSHPGCHTTLSSVSCTIQYVVIGYPFYYFLKFYFYFILLYNTVLVLPYIDMNPPQVYMSSQSWTPLPPPTSHPISSLWIIPVHQPQASCILYRT